MVRLEMLGGREALVLGLAWDALTGDGDGEDGTGLPLRAQIEEAAARRAFGAQWAALLETGTRTYVGFVSPPSKGSKIPAKVYGGISAAALLSAMVSEINRKVLCIQRLEDSRFWICAAGPGQFDARTDVVLAEEDALRLIEDILKDDSDSDQHSVLAYGHRELIERGGPLRELVDIDRQRSARAVALGQDYEPRLQEGRFGEQTDDRKKDAQFRVLKRLGISAVTMVVLSGIVVLLIVVAALYLWMKSAAEKREAEELAAQLALQTQQASERKALGMLRMEAAIVDALKTQTATLPPAAFIAACWEVAQRYGPLVGGWGLESLRCVAPSLGSQPSAQLSLKLSGGTGMSGIGTAESLLAAAAALDGRVTLSTPAQATITAPLRGIVPRPGLVQVSALPLSQDVLKQYGTTWQVTRQASSQFSVTTAAPAAPSILYADPEKEGQPPPRNFSTVPPEQGFSLFDVQWSGAAQWLLPGVAFGLDDTSLSVQQIEIRPDGPGGMAFSVQGRFAVQR